MKKFYFFLALLLTFIGIGVTRAVLINTEGADTASDPSELMDGTTVIIGCPISSYNGNPVTFNNEDKLYDDGVTDNKGLIGLKQGRKAIDACPSTYAWVLEDGSEDGWFYIKNAETGRYWSFSIQLDDDETYDDEGIEFYIHLVKDKAEAKQFTFKGVREGIALMNPDVDQDGCSYAHVISAAASAGCMMVMSKIEDGGQTYYYCVNDAVPGGMSNYTDWAGYMNVWTGIMTNDNAFDEFEAYINQLPIQEYPIGNDPGCVNETEAAKKYNKAIEDYRIMMDEPEGVDWVKALADLKALIASLPTFTYKPVTPGYYRIPSAKNGNYMFINGNGDCGCRTAPEEPSLNDLWQVYKNDKGEDCMINLGTSKFIIPVAPGTNSVSMKGGYEEQPITFECTNQMTVGEQKFTKATFNIWAGQYLHTQGTNLLVWYDKASVGDMWLFESVSESELKETFGEGIIEQLDLNREYYKLLKDAQDIVTNAKSAGDTQLVTDASQISSPASQSGEGTIAALIDGDYGTYWHSAWSGGDVSADNSLHYLQFDLRKAVQTPTMKYCRRPSSNDHPTNFEISASNEADGEYTVVVADLQVCVEEVEVDVLDADGEPTGEKTTETRVTAGKNNTLYSYALDFGAEYRYVRVRATMTDLWRGYWHASEMYFVEAGADLWTPVQAEGEALEAAIAAAKAAVAEGGVTAEVIAALRAAYEAFVNAYPDPAPLQNMIAEANNQLNTYEGGNEPGNKPADVWNNLKSAADAASAWLKANMATATKAQYAEQEGKLKAALEAWYAAKTNGIDSNKWYYIQMPNARACHTTTDYYEAGESFKDARMAACYGQAEELEDFGYPETSLIGVVTKVMYEEEADDIDDEMLMWRFLDAGNGLYVIQNKATGNFMPPFFGSNDKIALSPIPGQYFVSELAGGKLGIGGLYANNEGKTAMTYCNIYGQGYIGGYFAEPSTDGGSQWKLVYAEDVEDEPLIMFGHTLRGMVLPYAIKEGETGEANGLYTNVVNINTEEGVVEFENAFEVEAGKPFFFLNEKESPFSVEMTSKKFNWSVDHSGNINGTLSLGQKVGAGVLVAGADADGYAALVCTKGEQRVAAGAAWIDYKGDESLVNNDKKGDASFTLDMKGGNLQDGIAVVKGEKRGTMYNLNGQRVTAPVKGLYIVNGKKVVVK